MISKLFLSIALLFSFSYGMDKQDIKKIYEDKDYRNACRKAGDLYQRYSSDQEFLSMYAHACLESDMINRMMLPIIKLYETPEARENAAYFATVLYQKKLLYHALVDEVDISYVNLPSTEYILSKIFNRFVSGDYDYKNGAYWFKDREDASVSYKLSAEEHQKTMKLFLRTFKDGEVLKVRTYW